MPRVNGQSKKEDLLKPALKHLSFHVYILLFEKQSISQKKNEQKFIVLQTELSVHFHRLFQERYGKIIAAISFFKYSFKKKKGIHLLQNTSWDEQSSFPKKENLKTLTGLFCSNGFYYTWFSQGKNHGDEGLKIDAIKLRVKCL